MGRPRFRREREKTHVAGVPTWPSAPCVSLPAVAGIFTPRSSQHSQYASAGASSAVGFQTSSEFGTTAKPYFQCMYVPPLAIWSQVSGTFSIR